MQPHKHCHCKERRHFFKKAAVFGAAAFFGAAGRRRLGAVGPGAAPTPSTRGRYRLTAHIRKYYQRASQ